MMTPKYPIKAFDGTTASDVQVLNVPAGAIDPNGEIDLGQGLKVYRALLTQTGTDAPVATVLENTLGGTVVWTRHNTGVYRGTLAGAFPDGQTQSFCSALHQSNSIQIQQAAIARRDSGTMEVYTTSTTTTYNDPDWELQVSAADGVIESSALSVEIRVYP